MPILEKNGYLLSIESWVGNLGNHLIQLSCALNVAEKTRSRLTIPEHHLLRRRVFDFMNKEADYKTDCFQYPIVFDADRRRVFQDHVYEMLVRKNVRERVKAFWTDRESDRVHPETLVINMRSGRDIFQSEPPPQNDYMQPPLSFYRRIIESHRYEDCLIVTEAARKNPCIDGLVKLYPRVRIKTHVSVADDMRTLLSARHLVTCHSTFSWCMALMSRDLQSLHQPSSFQIRGVDDFSVDTYECRDYIKPGEWTASAAQLELMLNHDPRNIEVFHRPAGAVKGREPEPSHLW
jgi:hypothetical protein